MRDVLDLHLSKGTKQVYGDASVEPSAMHICDPLLLCGNVSFTLSDMSLSFLKVPQLHRAIHNAAYS